MSQGTKYSIPSGSELLSAISEIIKDLFIQNNYEVSIQMSLQKIADLTHADRTYIFTLTRENDELIASQLYEYAVDGVTIEINNPELQNVPLRSSGYGRWADAFESKRCIEGSINTFPDSEQPLLKAQNIVSLICIPIYLETKLWGFFGLDLCRHEHIWQDDEKRLLGLYANVIAGAIVALQQEHALLKQKSTQMQFYELVENTPSEIHIFDAETLRFSYMNKQAIAHLGYTKSELQDISPNDIVYGMDPKEIFAALLPLLNDEENQVVVEAQQITKKGEVYPVETRLARMQYNGKEHMVALVNDISERRAVEDELQMQKKLFEDLFRGSADAAMILKDDTFIDANNAAIKMFGLTKDEVIGSKVGHFSPSLQPDGVSSDVKAKEMIDDCMVEGNAHFEWVNKNANGETFWSDIVLTKLEHKDEKLIHAVMRDISQRKRDEEMILLQQNQLAAVNDTLNERYEEQLRLRQELEFYKNQLEERVKVEVEKNREKDRILHDQSKSVQMGEMLSMIAHQWRQPLNAISASAISVAMKQRLDELTPDAINSHTKFVQTQTQMMSKTIDDFMDFFKPEHEKQPFTTKALMNDVISLLGAQLQSRGIVLNYNKETTITVYGYKKELTHVMINLISNARDAYENQKIDDKSIDINFETDKENIKISVEDHAGGISEDLLGKIFNPYFTTKEQGKGTGIGLYMNRRIVQEIFGGTIDVEKTKTGLRFILVLPQNGKKDEI